MQENRPYGSEGGEAKSLPYPYRKKYAREKSLARALLPRSRGVGLQCADAFGERAAAFGNGAGRGRAVSGFRRDYRLRRQHGLDRRVRAFELDRKLCPFGGEIVDALAHKRILHALGR